MNVFDVLRKKLEKCKDSHLRLADDTKEMTELQFAGCYINAIEIVNQVEQEYSNGWIPSEYPPKDDKPVLLSFANFSVPLVGRYDIDENCDGAYYVGDEDIPLVKQDIFVNAWQPLPPRYEPKGE